MSFISDPWDTIAPEELLRAQAYGLLGRLLSEPPTAELLTLLKSLKGDRSELGRVFRTLSATARRVTVEDVEVEYRLLFIAGDGQFEPCQVSPYASKYSRVDPTSMLYQLRSDMERFGISAIEDMDDPEDHIATLCEMMAGLITGAFGPPADLDTQNYFFDTHIGPWAHHFFEKLEAAPAAAFYMPVGSLGRRFLEVEVQAFAMAA